MCECVCGALWISSLSLFLYVLPWNIRLSKNNFLVFIAYCRAYEIGIACILLLCSQFLPKEDDSLEKMSRVKQNKSMRLFYATVFFFVFLISTWILYFGLCMPSQKGVLNKGFSISIERFRYTSGETEYEIVLYVCVRFFFATWTVDKTINGQMKSNTKRTLEMWNTTRKFIYSVSLA